MVSGVSRKRKNAEGEKMRRCERLAAAKMMNIEYRILLRRTGVEGKTKREPQNRRISNIECRRKD
jgi:hypothetical protein